MAAMQLQGAAGVIEAVLDEPDADKFPNPQGTAVIAHPHPLFGGTMENKVVQTLSRAFLQSGWRTVRFNFRGVGATEGVHDDGRGELEDMLVVIEQTVGAGKLAIAGFSFGAFVASNAIDRIWQNREVERIVLVGTATSRWQVAAIPQSLHDKTLVVHGENDDTVELSATLNWARPQNLPVTVVPQGGHFFHGQLTLLKNLVMRHLR